MDSLDYGIIDLLRQNARAGYGDIGEVIGLSASAVKRRVDRLVADKVIRGFTIQVDPAVDGLGTEAYVELFCRGTVAPEELRRILAGVSPTWEETLRAPRAAPRGAPRSSPTRRLSSGPQRARAGAAPPRPARR